MGVVYSTAYIGRELGMCDRVPVSANLGAGTLTQLTGRVRS